MQFYKDIFQHSWKITRKHKFLWWFGLFTLLWSGKGIESELFFTNARLLRDPLSPFNPNFWQFERWVVVINQLIGEKFSASEQIIVLVLSLLMIGLLIFIIMVMMFAQVGLVDAFAAYGKSRQPDSVNYSLDQAMRTGHRDWPAVLGINIIGKAISYGLLAVVALPLFMADGTGQKFATTVILFFLLTPLSIIISFLIKYAVNFIVIQKKSMTAAMAASWRLFRQNIGASLELAFLMVVAYFLVNLAAVVAAVLVTLPLLILMFVSALNFNSLVGLYLYVYIYFIVMFFAVVLSAVLFATWHFGNWTLLFLELTKGKKQARIQRFLTGAGSTKVIKAVSNTKTAKAKLLKLPPKKRTKN